MATYYWTKAAGNGTGTWDASTTTNWASTSGGAGGAGVPTSSDNVIFDTNSFTTTGRTCTLSGSPVCNNVDMSAVAAANTIGGSGTLTVSGNFAGSGSLTWSASGTVTFNGTTTGLTITTNTMKLSGSWTFNGVGGGWTLQDNLTFNTGKTLTITTGSFSSGGHNIGVSVISTSGTNTRSVTLDNSAITLDGAIGTCLQLGTGVVGLTWSASGTTWTVATTGTTSYTCNLGNSTLNIGTSFTLAGVGSGNITFALGSIIVGSILRSRRLGGTFFFASGSVTTITTAITLGGSGGSFTSIKATTGGIATTINFTGGTSVYLNWVKCQDITAQVNGVTGGWTVEGGTGINISGNSGILFSPRIHQATRSATTRSAAGSRSASSARTQLTA